MSNFKMLFYPFALFMWLGTILTFTRYSQDLSKALQERELEIISNYAVDAAVDEMVDLSKSLDMDYYKNGYAKVDPEVALNMFVTMFLKGYNMSPSEENITMVRSKYIPMFCVAAYDGYYIATEQHVFEPDPSSPESVGLDSYDLRFTPKIPYIYKYGSSTYALNLKGNKCYKVVDSSMSLRRNADNPFPNAEGNLKVINTLVSDHMMKTVYDVMEGDVRGSVLIPSVMGDVYSTHPIKDITVFAYVANVPLGWGGESVDTFGIGGAQVKKTDFVTVYTRGGKKYYQYLHNLVKHGFDRNDSRFIDYYETPEEAAEAGYYYDFELR